MIAVKISVEIKRKLKIKITMKSQSSRTIRSKYDDKVGQLMMTILATESRETSMIGRR